jgi:hypothetical protein
VKTLRWDFISAHAGLFVVQQLCGILQVSRSGYYRWIAGAQAPASPVRPKNRPWCRRSDIPGVTSPRLMP